MNELLRYLANCGPLLFIGTATLLGIGCLAILISSTPIHRQRLGELTVVATLLWMLLAVTPLPRLLPRTEFQLAWNASSTERSAANAIHRALPETDSVNLDATAVTPISIESIFDESAVIESEFSLQSGPVEPEVADSPSKPISHAKIDPVTKSSVSSTFGNQDVISTVTVVYAFGVVTCFAWLAVGQTLLVTLRWRSRLADPWLQDLFETLAWKANVPRARLLISSTCRRAVSWGAIWPVIVLPTGLCQRKNEAQLRMILLHELGHTSQGDALGNLLLNSAFPLLYVQPLFWWLRTQVRLAAELVADDYAARQTDKETYALELIALARMAKGVGALWGVTGVVSAPSQFFRRMQMLIVRETPLALKPSATWRMASLATAAISIALAAALFGTHPAEGQQAVTDEVPKAAQIELSQAPVQSSADKKPEPGDPKESSDFALQNLPVVGRLFTTVPSSDSPATFTDQPKPNDSVDAKDATRGAAVVEVKSSDVLPSDQGIIIRGADGNSVEITFEKSGKSGRLKGKGFLIRGNRILEVDDEAKSRSKEDQKAALTRLQPNDGQNDTKGADVDKDGYYRVPKIDKDGTIWLETWKHVEGEGSRFVDRTPIPKEMVEQNRRQNRIAERDYRRDASKQVYQGVLNDREVQRAMKQSEEAAAQAKEALDRITTLSMKNNRTDGRSNELPDDYQNSLKQYYEATARAFEATSQVKNAIEQFNRLTDQKTNGTFNAPPTTRYVRPGSRGEIVDPAASAQILREFKETMSRSTPPQIQNNPIESDPKSYSNNPGTINGPMASPRTAPGKAVDLISLATSYADALSSIEAATDPESKQRASRKANLLLRIAQVEFKGVSEDCQRMEQLLKQGAVSLHQVKELQSRRDILREILDANTPAKDDPKPATVERVR